MAKVNIPLFIVAGMFRSGTTFLYHYFQKHPLIWVPIRKETEYFGVNYHRGLKWFLHLYRGMGPEQIGCDISTSYFTDPSTIGRIKSFNPEVKVILSVRDPVEVALSLYAHLNTFLWKMPSFEEFINTYNLPRCNGYYKLEFSSGQITRGIESYCEAFGKNLLLYSYELFKKDPLLTLQYIERFLGIPNYFTENNFKNIVINALNRKNIKFLYYLTSRESLVNFVETAFPRKVTLFIRKIFYESMCQPNTCKDKKKIEYDPDHVRLATELLKEDKAYYNKLFQGSKIQLGNGKPFDDSLNLNTPFFKWG